MEFQFPQAPLQVLLLLSITLFRPSLALNQEGLALLSFKSSIQEDPHASLANWNSSSVDPCHWNGITCSEGKVVAISLPKNDLVGSLPSSLGSLSSLRHINLRSNRLHGSLPTELFTLAGLQSLVLYGNSFSGPVPADVGGLQFLKILDLSQNLLHGAIPASISQCTSLRVLDLSHNRLTSSLPHGIGENLTTLEKLNLSDNKLNGSIPDDLGNLSSIRGTLDLSHNLFSGPIPSNLVYLPEKVYIDLSFNNLSCSIPQNGALVNRGPTAFLGNPNLCGPPLKNPCSSTVTSSTSPSQLPSLPSDQSPPASELSQGKSSNGVSKKLVIAIVVGNVVAIGIMAMLFFYCYRTAVSSKMKVDIKNTRNGDSKYGKNYFCCKFDELEMETENNEQFDLISLDKQVHFDMDKLLKGSAYVLERSEIGILFKVVLEDGHTLAIRRLGINRSQRFKDFQREVEAIGKVRHPNIVLLRAYYWSPNEKLLIYDYLPNGNLSNAMHGDAENMNFSPMSWHSRLKITKGIAKGLAFLHEFSPKKYLHGDLKPSNILLGFDMEPYISGFGLGQIASMESNYSSGNQLQTPISDVSLSPIWSNSLFYQAPEALKSFKPSQKWDVYSFGVIVLELISGRSPAILMDTSEMDLVRWVLISIKGKKNLLHVVDPYLTREQGIQEDIITAFKLALSCVQFNAESRPTMRHVVDSLDKLTWQEMLNK